MSEYLRLTRFGPKKSRPRYISAQKFSTLFDALDNFQTREQSWPYLFHINYNSNMTSFFRFVNKWAIYWLGIINKLCATLSANVNINYRLPIKVYYRPVADSRRGFGGFRDCRANVEQFNHQCFERGAKICEPLDIEVKKPRICGR